MATTLLELVPVGQLADRNSRSTSGAAPAVVEVFPGVFLVATVRRARNQCVLELAQPTCASSTDLVPDESQRRLSETLRPRPGTSQEVHVPATLKSEFCVPRIIQLLAKDEGVIETVTLVRDPLEPPATATHAKLKQRSAPASLVQKLPSINDVHIHFFIGTSNGTVLIGNALGGTILAVAQFQHYQRADDFSDSGRLTTTSAGLPDSRGPDDAIASSTARAPARNESIVKFVVQQRSRALLWNPSVPTSQRPLALSGEESLSSATSQRLSSLPFPSPTVGSHVVAVHVVHSGGKVVVLTRDALDVFVRTSVKHLDGRRPHLVLEWTQDTSDKAFPVVGPASEFAAHVKDVFLLEPGQGFSAVEQGTKLSTACSTAFAIHDADVFMEPVHATTILPPSSLNAVQAPCVTLLIGGTQPFFSSYRLQYPSPSSPASSAVKAIAKAVAGVGRSLWSTAFGSTRQEDRRRCLSEISATRRHTFLQADAKCAAVQIDGTQQWAAFAVEGGGRIYVADVQTGVVSTVLKGCRAAQFIWWWTERAGGRPAQLFVVHLPLRGAVEVYTTRSWQRLAACYVPEGSVLLRCAGGPWEAQTPHEEGNTASRCCPCDGNGTHALFMDPKGTIFSLRLRWAGEAPAAGHLQLLPTSSRPQLSVPAVDTTTPTNALPTLSLASLRTCRTPDDFLTFVLQFPLPALQFRLEPDTPGARMMISGGDEVRAYLKNMKALCKVVQRRFAPGWAEIVTTPMPCAARAILEGAATAIPTSLTAAQCLHYIQLHVTLVKNYYRLITCKPPAVTRHYDPQQWSSALIKPDLWTTVFSTPAASTTTAAAAAAAFMKTVDSCVVSFLAPFVLEQGIYKKMISPYVKQIMRGSTSALATEKKPQQLSNPNTLMLLPEFLHCFYVGTARPTLLRSTITRVEDADGSVNLIGQLSDLVFGMWGLDSFLAQLPALRDVGCTDSDVALLTVTWIAHQAARDINALMLTSTIGCLSATLLKFSDANFVSALDRAPIPLVSMDGGLARRAAVDCVTGLLWFSALRVAIQPFSCVAHRENFERRMRQLLQLWRSLTNGVIPAIKAGDSVQDEDGTEEAQAALFLRLGNLEPLSAASVGIASNTAVVGSAGGTHDVVLPSPVDGDVVEVFLQRNGISITLLDGFTVPRPEANSEAAELFPLLSTFVSLLGEADHPRTTCSSFSPPSVLTLPWIEAHQWNADHFANEVIRPIQQLWQQWVARPLGKTRGRNTSPVYTSCLLLVAMGVLQHALRPLTDVRFTFWDANTLPDGDFFPLNGGPAGLVLAGSRTSREYLRSVQELVRLVEKMLLLPNAVPQDTEECVLFIQQISAALADDDALLFPLIPNFLRARLTIWMQVLAQAPRVPLRRARRVRQLVDLILFLSEVSSLTMGRIPLTALQSRVSIPWKRLICGPNRRVQLQLLPVVFLTEMESPPQTPSVARGDGYSAALQVFDESSAFMVFSPYTAEEEDLTGAPFDLLVAASFLRDFFVASAAVVEHVHELSTDGETTEPYAWLLAEDTRQCLSRLAECLGLQEVLPDMAAVVLLDYAIKHLLPVVIVEQAMLLLSTTFAAPQVAASALQSLLGLVLRCMVVRRTRCGQRGDSAEYDAASEQLHGMLDGVSDDLRKWLQEREDRMKKAAVSRSEETATPAICSRGGLPATSTGRVTSGEWLLRDPDWITLEEHQSMMRLVSLTLSLPKTNPQRRGFFQLLFTLAQWVCEKRVMSPPLPQRLARELPQVVKKWETLL